MSTAAQDPPKFVRVEVLLSEAEARKLYPEAVHQTQDGDYGAALRIRAGLPHRAYGLSRATQEGTAEVQESDQWMQDYAAHRRAARSARVTSGRRSPAPQPQT